MFPFTDCLFSHEQLRGTNNRSKETRNSELENSSFGCLILKIDKEKKNKILRKN